METRRSIRTPGYNYNFNPQNGYFERWGNTLKDDPDYAPIGCEILDLETSTGECDGACRYCYKGNGPGETSHHMTLDQFKTIISKFPVYEYNTFDTQVEGGVSMRKYPVLTQIACGITSIMGNPDFFPIMEYARSLGITPNYTCNGLHVTEEIARKTAALCGAVAVSVVNKEKTYDTIKMFTDAGMKQVNIHYVLCEERYDLAFEVIKDRIADPRLQKMHAIVFLMYKNKGKNPDAFHSIQDVEKYKKLTKFCEENNVIHGFDSCSAPLYLKTVQGHPQEKFLSMLAEPCESTRMSSYINSRGFFFPCSFMEGMEDWKEGIDVLHCNDFLKDVWYHPRTVEFRNKSVSCMGKSCPCPFVL